MTNAAAEKQKFATRVDSEINAHFKPNTWSVEESLILAAHILAENGHFGGLAGQCASLG